MNTSPQDIQELRKQLFASLTRLSADGKIDAAEIERAKAIADTAQTIINSAKVEVDFVKIAGGKGSGFIPLAPPEKGPQVIEQRPGVRITRHKLADD
jgi:hypothetical protein